VSDNTGLTSDVPVNPSVPTDPLQPQSRRERRLQANDNQAQPQSRRERRLLEMNAAAASVIPSVSLSDEPTHDVTTQNAPAPQNIPVQQTATATAPQPSLRLAKETRGSRRTDRRATKANNARPVKHTWSASLRGAVVVVVSAFMVAVSLPSTGFNLAAPGFAAPAGDVPQVVTVSDTTETAEAIVRDGYKVSSYGDLYGLRFGSLNFSYTVLNTGPIRWPFPAAVPVSSGYGQRQAPCAACSSNHNGLDFNPGAGSPIYAVADGVVVESHNDRWGFGRWIVIRHDVNGLQFDSTYAHMQRDSVTLNVGDPVLVADYIGRVGSTGTSTGAHLHLEIHVNGAQVDPFAWLKSNTAQ